MPTADGAEADIPSDEECLVLFEQLRQDGYQLVPHQLEATLAIIRLAHSEKVTADQLVYLLTPILATSPEEQADLQNRLARWRRPAVVGQVEPVQAETETPSIPTVARRGRAWAVVAAAAGVLALALLIGYALNQPNIPIPLERLSPTTGPNEPQTTTQTITTVFYVTSPFYGLVRWGLALAPLGRVCKL